MSKKSIIYGEVLLIVLALTLFVGTASATEGAVFPWTFPVSFAGEGETCIPPVISSLTNSTPGTSSVTITWSTDRSADNLVKYSKNSDLSSPYYWSSWDNDTTSVSIGVTGLDSGSAYYYQAWSYNGTNSSCYDSDPSEQPYKTFTTQSEGGGAYNITLPQGWSIIGWTNLTTVNANYVAGDVGGNCIYVTEKNKTTGEYVNFNPSSPTENNFDVERGWGYYVQVSEETLWSRSS